MSTDHDGKLERGTRLLFLAAGEVKDLKEGTNFVVNVDAELIIELVQDGVIPRDGLGCVFRKDDANYAGPSPASGSNGEAFDALYNL